MSRRDPGRQRTSPALWVLYTDTFTMAVGFYMLVPLLAVHFLDGLGMAIALVGVLSAIRSISQNGLMPVAGWIADRVDYKRAISVGVLIRAAGFAMFGVVDSTSGLVVASVLTGMGGALFHPASYAAYAALAQGRDRIKVYATREMVSNLGFVVGPVVGGLVAGLDFSYVSWTSAGLFVMVLFVTLVGLPNGLAGRREEKVSLRKVFADRAFVRYCVLASALWFLVSQLYLVVPVRARDVLPGTAGLGVVYSAAAVLMVATTIPIAKLTSTRMRPASVLALGALALSSGIAVMGLWDTAAGLFVGVGVFTLGQIVTQPTMNAIAAGYAKDGSVASYFGVQGLAFAIGGVIGNTMGGLLYTLAGGSGGVALVPWFVFLVWGAVLALVLLRPGALTPVAVDPKPDAED
ncbi:MFS transporter [Sanguibacter antarcticus]|uniref:DHA1 family multidrug resistance protein-like MFS transporter n=1 Tax=Sanguibacter antarcticus TaxID=372484 RepID=A0A2A9E0J9_9MICO|nr:MFS transporter [Sanguibacter antarcticus]PFG32363.1 DHA1 family multidrug resistance protein-like MFS transporter [Sanguibacter antarcticus]